MTRRYTLPILSVAILVAGLGVPTGTATATGSSPAGDPATIPRNLTYTAGNAVVRLDWEAPEAGEGSGPAAGDYELISYVVYRLKQATGEPERVGSTIPGHTEFLDFSVENGRDYTYEVRALYDNKVLSGASGRVTATPEVSYLVIRLTLDQATALVNGDEATLDAPAQLVGDSTMVPLRFVGSSLGAGIQYDAGPRQITATLGSRVVRLWIGKREAEIDGEKVTIAAAPAVINDRTMVPVRFISEAFGALVAYDGATKRITVTMDDADTTFEAAALLTPGTPVKAALNGSNDVDMFKIPTGPGETYVVRTYDLATDCDTVLAVVNADGVRWYSDDLPVDSLGSEVQVYEYGFDQYVYVRVQSADPGGANPAGNYTIVAEKRLGADTRTGPTLQVNGEPITSAIESASDSKFFFFKALQGNVYRITATNLEVPEGQPRADVAIFLYSFAHGGWLTAGYRPALEGSGVQELLWECPYTWDYGLSIESTTGRPGAFSVKVETVTGLDEGPYETRPDRDGWLRWLTNDETEDWFFFRATAGTTYHIQTYDLGPFTDTEVAVFSARTGGQLLAYDDDARGCGEGSQLAWQAPSSSTYYVRVNRSTNNEYWNIGAYTFSITTTGPEYDSYDLHYATELAVDGSGATGSLLEYDIDWFSFEASRGVTYTVATSG
ncbi:MAG: hypothetical protein C4551_02850, partial [Bacillota bacterium]